MFKIYSKKLKYDRSNRKHAITTTNFALHLGPKQSFSNIFNVWTDNLAF